MENKDSSIKGRRNQCFYVFGSLSLKCTRRQIISGKKRWWLVFYGQTNFQTKILLGKQDKAIQTEKICLCSISSQIKKLATHVMFSNVKLCVYYIEVVAACNALLKFPNGCVRVSGCAFFLWDSFWEWDSSTFNLTLKSS